MGLEGLPQQIFQSKVDIREDGTSISGFPLNIAISSQSIDIRPEFWESSKDTSLGGDKRSNIRGYTLVITFDYDVSLEPEKIKKILDNQVKLISSDYSLHVYIDKDETDSVEMIPTSNSRYGIEYDHTVRRGGSSAVLTTLEFESKRIEQSLDDFFDS